METSVSGHGAIWWNELNTRDLEKAKAFYGRLMGWTFAPQAIPGGTYWLAIREGQEAPVCGFFSMEGPEFEGAPDHWMTYLAVDDVDRRCREAAAAGGTVCKGPFDVPGVARMAMVQDATGAMVALATPEARGAGA